MKKILKVITILSFASLLTSCGSDQGFNDVIDYSKKIEYCQMLRTVKMFEPEKGNTNSGTLTGNLSLLNFIDIGIKGTITGRYVTSSSFVYYILITDSKGANIVQLGIYNAAISINLYDYSISGIQILTKSTMTEKYDLSFLSSLFSGLTINFFKLLSKNSNGNLILKSSRNSNGDTIILIDELDAIKALNKSMEGDELWKVVSGLSGVYFGPSLNSNNVLTGLYGIGNLHYFVDVAFYANIMFNI